MSLHKKTTFSYHLSIFQWKEFSRFLIFILVILPFVISACFTQRMEVRYTPQDSWVDSVMRMLSPREKLGQLFAIRAHSNLSEEHHLSVEKLIKDYKIGGLCFFQGGPHRQVKLINRYQQISKVPLLVSIDGEWGLGMRLDSTMSFPRQMTLGAIQNDSLIYWMGKEIAAQCRRVGVQLNFAPVVDINNNPNNPVIGDRSFGEDKENVARKGVAYMRGMQDNGVIANAKHFPGHGDTDKDSHYTLPVIQHSKERLSELELYPFKQLIQNGLQSAMVAHLKIPAYDSIQTTLSYKVIHDLLKNDLGFKGLVFTDALEMKGVANYFATGEVDVLALLAGNDVLLLSGDVGKAIEAIEKAIQAKKISWEEIDKRVRKILEAKYRVGLHQWKPIELKNLAQDLYSPKAKALQNLLYRKAMTLVKNESQNLPILKSDSIQMASVAINTSGKTTFQGMLDYFGKFEHYQIAGNALPFQYQTLLPALKKKNKVIFSLHSLHKRSAENYGIPQSAKILIDSLSRYTQVTVVVFGTPYSTFQFNLAHSVVCAYEENTITQKVVPQMLFGVFPFEGKLPVSSKQIFQLKSGVETSPVQFLGYALPEEVGLNTDSLKLADQIIQSSIEAKMLPGCQFLIARKGKIVWHKNLGELNYSKKNPVNFQTVYDVASLTKIAATLQAIMWLYDKGKLDLDKRVSDYLEELKGTNKEVMTLKEVLTHQAGLIPYIPHYEKTLLKNKNLNPKYYAKNPSAQFSLPIAEGIYGLTSLEDSLWKWTVESNLTKKDSLTNTFRYEYSDLGFYILKRVAEKLLNEPIEQFLSRELYQPLGMSMTTFNPLNKFNKNQIAPTEKDTYFRHQTIRGYVHDQGACMLGGVGGHAGLFSTTYDLALLLQMHLQGGSYNGRQYFKKETIDLFLKPPFDQNHRALGWDRVDTKRNNSYAPDLASSMAVGHSGFTGCVMWMDKAQDLVIVLLSNRVHPSVENAAFVKEHIRRKVLNQVYKAIQKDFFE